MFGFRRRKNDFPPPLRRKPVLEDEQALKKFMMGCFYQDWDFEGMSSLERVSDKMCSHSPEARQVLARDFTALLDLPDADITVLLRDHYGDDDPWRQEGFPVRMWLERVIDIISVSEDEGGEK